MHQTALRAPIAVSLGAIGGALSRYYLGHWVTQTTGVGNFPVGTLTANVLGCFLIGVLTAGVVKREGMSAELRLLVATGFLGSLTTFSSYSLDTVNLFAAENWRQGWGYGLGSPVLGLLSFYSGTALATNLLKPRAERE
ncbi:MAG: fluoride efflux transporter CrcB [Nodosilinea sp.]